MLLLFGFLRSLQNISLLIYLIFGAQLNNRLAKVHFCIDIAHSRSNPPATRKNNNARFRKTEISIYSVFVTHLSCHTHTTNTHAFALSLSFTLIPIHLHSHSNLHPHSHKHSPNVEHLRVSYVFWSVLCHVSVCSGN